MLHTPCLVAMIQFAPQDTPSREISWAKLCHREGMQTWGDGGNYTNGSTHHQTWWSLWCGNGKPESTYGDNTLPNKRLTSCGS